MAALWSVETGRGGGVESNLDPREEQHSTLSVCSLRLGLRR